MEYRHKTRGSAQAAVVDPHGPISAGRSWYLCSSHDADLLFTKLSRIDSAEVLPEPCRASEVEVGAAWRARREQFLGGFTAISASAWVRETRWSDAQEWAIRATEVEPTALWPAGEGWSFLELEFVDRLHAMTILLSLGPDAELVGPTDLRDELVNYLESTLRRYAD